MLGMTGRRQADALRRGRLCVKEEVSVSAISVDKFNISCKKKPVITIKLFL